MAAATLMPPDYIPMDWHLCNPVYGTNLQVEDCLTASGKFPYRDGRLYSMPLQKSHG